MNRTTRLLLAALAALALFAGACGGDDDGSSSSGGGGGSTEEAGGGSDGGDQGAGGDCPGTSLTGSLPGTDGFSGGNAVAASLADGKAFTVYLADFELSTDDFTMFSNPEVPAGGTMYMLAITAFNADPADLDPVAVGDTFTYTPDFEVMTMRVTGYDDANAYGDNNVVDVGTVSVTAVGDTFCGTVDYRDGEKSLSGTFQAPVKAV